MKENYELIDNEERHQYEFHIERYVPRIEYIIQVSQVALCRLFHSA